MCSCSHFTNLVYFLTAISKMYEVSKFLGQQNYLVFILISFFLLQPQPKHWCSLVCSKIPRTYLSIQIHSISFICLNTSLNNPLLTQIKQTKVIFSIETLPKLTMNKMNYAIKNLKKQFKDRAIAVTGSNISSLPGESQPIIPNSDHDDERVATGSLSSQTTPRGSAAEILLALFPVLQRKFSPKLCNADLCVLR
jgi:hypothetical protein